VAAEQVPIALHHRAAHRPAQQNDILQLQSVQKLLDVHGQPGDAVAIGGFSGLAVASQVHSDHLVLFCKCGNIVAKGLCALIPAVEYDQSLSGTLNLIVDGDSVICYFVIKTAMCIFLPIVLYDLRMICRYCSINCKILYKAINFLYSE
jgi:hypothetical protein